MEGWKRLYAESKRFYFVLLILVSVCVLMDCFITFGGYGAVDQAGVMHTQEALGEVEPEVLFENTYLSFEEDLLYRFTDIDGALLYGMTLGGILILLALKQVAFSDERTREFRNMWPVKSWVRELYDYFSVLCLVLWGILLQLVVLLVIQNRYNSMLMEYIGVNRQNALVSSLMNAANEQVVLILLYYMFSVIIMYTWIYLGICLAKNPVVGAIGSGLVWIAIHWVCDGWIWRFAYDNAQYYVMDGVVECGPWLYAYKILMTIQLVLSDTMAMDYYDSSRQCFQAGYGFLEKLEICSVETWLAWKLLLLVVLVCSIAFAAKKKELSCGKILYFPKLDYVVALFVGVTGGSIWMGTIISYDVERIVGYDLFTCLLIGAVSAVVTFLILHPRMSKEKQCLEVK